MALSAQKVLYLSLGLLAVFACVPVSRFLEPTPVPTDTSPAVGVAATESFTQTPTSTSTATPGSTNTPIVVAPTDTFYTKLYAFIQAPEGPLPQPYVTLFAFQSIPDVSIEISGIINSQEFVCRGSPCALPVAASSIVVFRAHSSAGSTSEDISATVRVEEGSDGYYVYLDAVSQFAVFSDSCLRTWDFKDYTNPTWAEFVQFPYLLNTNKTLHYLVTRLIMYGAVDVSGCPGGGLNASMDWPTGCGLERASSAMVEWQNKYDEYIWLASKEVGIPPKILKTLIEVESQFWPGDQRFYVDEIGLGQVNQLGVDVLLRRDPLVYQQVCSTVLDDCSMPYTLMSKQNQAMIRGAFINSQSALCPNCEYGLDMVKARQSVSFIAQVLRANCQTVKMVVDNYSRTGADDLTSTAEAATATAKSSDEYEEEDIYSQIEDPYSDFWKFTLLSYHSGISCFENALKNTPKNQLSWENLSQNIACKGGDTYVNGVWANLLNFDQYQSSFAGQQIEQVAPVFAPTRTPEPTPASAYSRAKVRVQVFLDRNRNGVPDEGEGLNGIPVLVQAVNEVELTGSTENGVAVLSLDKVLAGTQATVTLQGFFRSETFNVPAQGEVPITFKFDPPELPTLIP